MIGGTMKTMGWVALLAVGGLMLAGSVSANAADLGGDCCADLEERVAELEATTARKGNRKVSLEISGQVNEAVMWWDDGFESNAYQVTNDNSRSRFRFKGKAKIDSDWEAGYLLEIGVRGANSKRADQNNPDGCALNVITGSTDCGLDVRHTAWYLKSKKHGAVWVGLSNSATQDITEINLTQTGSFAKYSDVEDSGLGMRLRTTAGGLSDVTWRRLLNDSGDQPGEGDRINAVRYVSPEWHGFTASWAWGEDDIWDVALRYEGEFNGIKLAAGFGYGNISDGTQTLITCKVGNVVGNPASSANLGDCEQVGGSFSVIHEPTGLFLNFGAGWLQDNLLDSTVSFTSGTSATGNPIDFIGTGADDSDTFFSVQAGIERKWNEYGKTTIYGEYFNQDGGANGRRRVAAADAINPFGVNSRIFNSGLDMYGAGVAQGFDKAAMVMYLSYRHYEADMTLMSGTTGVGALADVPLEDLDIVMGGAIIKF